MPRAPATPPEKITAHYRALINAADPEDPLARMVQWSPAETVVKDGELADPIGDARHQCGAHGRLIHRYPDRVLILVTDQCPAHCRFCFRRHQVGQGGAAISEWELAEVVRYISSRPGIREAILSGGDPLSLADGRLLEIIAALRTAAGVRAVRLHTRYPIYDPDRCRSLGSVAEQLDTVVVHVNHPREITAGFARAVSVLRAARWVLNQSVLLRGVNDSVAVLEALSRDLAAAGVLPYYLHYPDLAAGISHFRVPLAAARDLAAGLQARLPAYLVPRLVLDLPGGLGKVPLAGAAWRPRPDNAGQFCSPLTGDWVNYREVL